MDHDRHSTRSAPAVPRPTGWMLVRVPILAGAIALLAIAAAPRRSAPGPGSSQAPAALVDAGGCSLPALPPGHPPVAGFALPLPPGHPPISAFGLALPPGHPPVAGFGRALPLGHPPVGAEVEAPPPDAAPPAPLFEPPPTVEL